MGVYTDGKELLRDIIALSKGIDSIELKNKILEFQNIFYSLNDENRELRLSLEEYKRAEEDKSKYYYDSNVNAYRTDEDEMEFVCSHCLESESKIIRMNKKVGLYSNCWSFECPKCKMVVQSGIRHGRESGF